MRVEREKVEKGKRVQKEVFGCLHGCFACCRASSLKISTLSEGAKRWTDVMSRGLEVRVLERPKLSRLDPLS